MVIELLEAARFELLDATAWYDSHAGERLGNRFLAAVNASLDRIEMYPTAWPKLSASTRRCRLQQFPYGIVYQIRPDRILVVAIMHMHRRPGYWRDRTKPGEEK
ncbi:MAG TPA: type II toxin-antitoxin system RelE/ParE family toxin [Tepidisphaeraceae bacterium]|nr:type II toxin-antitoxin system RelE/ParE family toxin [Tepidisphaeraceae bacterium]